MNHSKQPLQRWSFERAGEIARALGLTMVLFWLPGCQLLQRSPPAPPAADTRPAVESALSMQSIIANLEAGRLAQAESDLLRLIDARPGNRLALRFLEQLQSDPIELMGEDYEELTVRSGESLSVIAARELGDGMQFFALARYNEISVPRQLAPGMRLKVPMSLKAEPALLVEEPVGEEPEVVVEQPGEGLALTGQQLIADQRYQQAVALLSAAARAGNLGDDGYQILAQAGVARARELAAADRPDAGLALLDRLGRLSNESARQQMEPERRRLQARIIHQQAVADRRAGRLEEALAAFQQATELDPEFDSARENTIQLRDLLVMQHHEEALVHYREQQLDEAIELWEQALALDEGFEPAQVYLARARALRSRLQDLDS